MTSLPTSAANKLIVLVLGAGPGTGFAVARRFAQAGHPVGLLSRTAANLEPLVKSINSELASSSSNKFPEAKAFVADATNAESVRKAVADASGSWGPDAKLWGGVLNTTGFLKKPFLDLTEDDVRGQFDTQVLGLLNFGQAIIKPITAGTTTSVLPSPSTAAGFVFVTGATASMKGGAQFGGFAASKFAVRAMAQSMAREFGPQGIHVAHIQIDGIIRTDRTIKMIGKEPEDKDSWLNPDDIAETYFALAQQRRSAFTAEIDIRPHGETF
ncbi:hypothetical protein OC846_003203 [Tilletia horrida]|uniref:Oxidoreductase n=1 Tax=Tilletia horrida TaxID=155126 RepID=A0AAN6GSM5_9BASI|nr:hypothetical protein OC845_006802 [Tilletia horrida]KAK0551711.1 hypothetical protein OC846_003203 [Tilletia horrida]KAK0569676.1 hypothetical protein OC861_000636 [Tilletia horrida]